LIPLLVQGRAGALQGALDRDLAGAQHADLSGAEAEHVTEHERGGLAGRQALYPRDEGQFDRLGGLIARLGARRGVADALEQRVGVRLQPGDLAAASGLGRLERGKGLGRDPAAGRHAAWAPFDAARPVS
jgi:hypothetical protein